MDIFTFQFERMPTFISQLSQFLLAQNKPVHEWVIVVPSQRSILYIQKELFEKAGKSLLSPKIITISRFFESISPLQILDKTRLLFQLYEVHQQVSTSDNKSFDEFYNWGATLMSDFDEIDRYQIDAKNLFKNLRDIKEIENWSFNAEELTESQIKFIKFWEELGVYYAEYQKKLAANNTSFMGHAVRQISENIDLIFKKYPTEKFLFAGFNAHAPVELSVMKQLMALGKAEVLFDGDDYYMKNGLHEAGAFIRKNIETLGIPQKLIEFKDNLSNKQLDVNLIACSQLTGQVKVAASILEEMSEQEIGETLLLLAEEDLLVPLLKNIPSKVGKANITLGLSLDNSVLKTWIELIFRIQKGLQTKSAAYHKDIFEVCYHPFVEEVLDQKEKQELIELEAVFKRNNLIYASVNQLTAPQKIKDILALIYTNWSNDWLFGIRQIRTINTAIYQSLSDDNEYEKALLETFDKGIIDLQNCLNEGVPQMSLATFKNIFTRHYASLTISYFGNPINGLQIMGLLETRMLDFKRIICIGMNEKNMPPSNQINSLIPMDLRRYFKLPTVRDKQGIFAHHFYRLLHEVEQLYITYSTNTQDFNSSEKSRYIMQMELELTKANPKVQFNYKDYTIGSSGAIISDHKIVKNEFNINLLKTYLQKGVSASALGNFYNCPLDFFYKYILKFNDEIRVEEDVESSTFGSLIHETLEDLYQPFANHTLQEKRESLIRFGQQQLDEFKERIDYQLHLSFKGYFKSEDAFLSGKNRLSFEMAKKLTHGFLRYEEKHLKNIQCTLYVEALELVLKAEIPDITIGNSNETITVQLKGIIDRIDYHNDAYHIIDYKSGKVSYKDLKPKKITEEDIYKQCKKEAKFLQFYFYLYLFYKNYKTYPQSITFVSFVNINEVESTENDGNNFEELIRLFPAVFQRIMDDICDESQPFEHAKNEFFSYCEFC